MAYSLNCEDEELDPHWCGGCEDTADENARISSGAWVHSDAYAVLKNDPTNAAIWEAQKLLGKIIILPELNGTFDGGTPKLVPGYGRLKERYSGSDFSSTAKDPVYAKNWDHYRSLVGKSSWHYAYNTSSKTHLTSVPVTVAPKNPITENLEDTVVWESTITWFEYFTPKPFDTPAGVFDCVNPEVVLRIITHPANQTLNENGTISIHVVAEGTNPLTYQWKKGGVDIAGATGDTYTKANALTTDSGSYTVVVSDVTGSITSNAATVTVNAIVFDTILTFASASTDTDQGVTGTITGTSSVKQFEFNLVTPRSGAATNMSLKILGVEVAEIDFTADYAGDAFRWTQATGERYYGVFTAGDVNLS